MRIFVVLLLATLLVVASSDTVSMQHRRRLNNAFNTVFSQMTAYYGPGMCTRDDSKQVTTVECSRPGQTAKFVARGPNTKPDFLRVCNIGAASNDCRRWNFADTDNPQSIVDQAFPTSARNPGPPYNQVFTAMKRQYPTPGACRVTPENGQTTVVCSDTGSTATMVADGVESPNPRTLQTCTLFAGGRNCKSWTFNAGQSVSTILAQAFPNDPRNATPFQQTVDLMQSIYRGNCKTTFPGNNKTQVTCSNGGSTATLIGSGTNNPTAETLEVCTLFAGGKHCSTYYYNSQSVADILAAAFPNSADAAPSRQADLFPEASNLDWGSALHHGETAAAVGLMIGVVVVVLAWGRRRRGGRYERVPETPVEQN